MKKIEISVSQYEKLIAMETRVKIAIAYMRSRIWMGNLEDLYRILGYDDFADEEAERERLENERFRIKLEEESESEGDYGNSENEVD